MFGLQSPLELPSSEIFLRLVPIKAIKGLKSMDDEIEETELLALTFAMSRLMGMG